MSETERLVRGALFIWAALLVLALVPTAGAWGASVHHDQAITLANALKRSLPQQISENVDGDLIYSLSLAPDVWRSATGAWGTWHYNMAENAYHQFENIREAWKNGDYDNAIARIGVVLHFVGDVMYMPHNSGVRAYYENNIPPIGSLEPLWDASSSGGETGKYFTSTEYFHATHYANQQAEAYTDSDSAWYPLKPENYGIDNYGVYDDGSLDWYLDSYLKGPDSGYTLLISDIETDNYPTNRVFPKYIRMCNPYDDPITGVYDAKLDNRWFYWVSTRDTAIPKQDADNTIRLAYNGVYRALRDGEYKRSVNPNANPPSDWNIWPWPTTSAWLSLNDDLYKEGMDTVRWHQGLINYGSTPEGSGQNVPQQPPVSLLLAWIALPVIFALVALTYIRLRSRDASETRF